MAFNPMTVNTPPDAAPHIYAEDDAAVFQSIFGGDGILSVGSRFKTEIKTNNLVRINDGVLCVGGHLGRIKYADYEDCVIENGETGYNRNDLIIGSFSNNGEHTIDEMKIEVLKGKATTGTAEDPVVMQGDLYQGEQLRQVPIVRVKLEGLNIVSADMLLPVIPSIPMINKYLSDMSNEEMEANGLRLCTNIHSAISTSSSKNLSFFKRGKTLNMTFNIELKQNVNQYATLLKLPEKFKPKTNQLFIAGGTTYSINCETGAITAQQKIVAGAWIQISIEYQL